MKRFWFVTVVVVVGLALASAVQAISQGPGGRIYFTQRSGSYDQIWSIRINSNWDNVGLSPVAQVSHGQVLDCNTNMYHLNYGISPEIANPGQASGFANLVMGLWYNGTPACQTPTANTRQAMDVVRITPTNGSNTVTLLGDGKALKKNDWYGRNDIGTDSGHFAYPDPTGGFTGASGRVVVSSSVYSTYTYINSDYNTDGDITNDNTAMGTGDYLARSTMIGYGWDAEMFNNRVYVSSSYTGHRPNPNGLDTAGIYYYERTGTASAPVLNTRVWWDDNLTAYKNPYWVKGGATGPLAATKVHGIPTTWVLIRDTVGTNAYSIAMMQDLNGNGQAMDNAQVTGTRNEYKIIYDAGDVTGFPGITEALDNPGAGWKDMELIRSADNTMFLFISNTASNWKYGMSVIVLQLDDNGDYTGGDSNAKLVYYAGVNGAGGSLPSTGFLIGTAMEFDATVSAIPEPATMLLLGTGVVAVSGFLRRRRLK